MKLNYKRSRLLASWVLTAILLSGLVALPKVHAGEPDVAGSPAPANQSQTTAMLPLAMRIQAVLQGVLGYLTQTLP